MTNEEFQDGMATKQDLITEDNKLPYSLVSGTPINLSDFTNDENFQTGTEVANAIEAAISGKQDVITVDNKLDYNLMSGNISGNLIIGGSDVNIDPAYASKNLIVNSDYGQYVKLSGYGNIVHGLYYFVSPVVNGNNNISLFDNNIKGNYNACVHVILNDIELIKNSQ